ncbi:MAG: hypothetical protein MN733_22120 [Nitrososphaera sp.]|nr:hypothetical protein [Nitrososphaera sp.]
MTLDETCGIHLRHENVADVIKDRDAAGRSGAYLARAAADGHVEDLD